MKQITLKHWFLLPFLLVLCLIVNISLGSVDIPLNEILGILGGEKSSEEVWTSIIWDFRMTKALTCILAGGALSVAGLLMQTLFRNALAGPDVLGLSSGASLAVSLIIMGESAGIRLLADPSPWTIVGAASAGCGIVFFLVVLISKKLRDETSLLIIGLMIGATAASLVSVMQFLSSADDQQMFLIWTFGSLGGLNWTEIIILAAVLLVGILMALYLLKPLNAWMLGDHYATSLGVNVRVSRFLIISSACLLTGAVTAFCGPIAFVGLAVPHLTRLLFKTHDQKTLIPAVVLAGAILMLCCDILAQLPGSTHVLPINAITALIGAPVVISIIMQAKRVAV
ncbi:MAG: iron ABC transporter permease [Chryseolinea sp.]